MVSLLGHRGYLREALAIARMIKSVHRDDRAEAIASLVPHAPASVRPALLNEALDTARVLGDDTEQAELRMRLARGLAGPAYLNETIAARWAGWRAWLINEFPGMEHLLPARTKRDPLPAALTWLKFRLKAPDWLLAILGCLLALV
jgi:hypothetical protein